MPTSSHRAGEPDPQVVRGVRRLWALRSRAGQLADADPLALALWSLSDQRPRPIEELEERNLILLGEPGSGKSTVLEAHRDALKSDPGGGDVLFVRLGQYGSEQRLLAEALRGDAVRRWRQGDHCLHVLIDAYDEGLTLLPHLPRLLLAELETWPLDRARLVITSRSADWSAQLEAQLAELHEPQGVYTIVALGGEQVAELAASAGVDASRFSQAVSKAGVGTLARSPSP